MKYNFDAGVDRRDNNAVKYDEAEQKFGRSDLIPLWIADMDLPTAQPVIDAMAKRNAQGIFGYTSRPESYFESVSEWQQKRNGWVFDPKLASFCPGVVPALAVIVREFTNKGDTVLFFTPVYSEFYDVTKDWGRIPLTVPLVQEQEKYQIDFNVLEEALKSGPSLFIFCHPHNPLGRVWTREELKQVGNLCIRYGVPVISDEIHSDLMLWNHKHIPMASVSEEIAANTITCTSATKTFNLAGLQASTIIFPDKVKKETFDRFWRGLDVHRNNCFSVVAVETAFREGEEWLEQALHYIEDNMQYVKDYLETKIPQIRTYLPDSTYLMWLDCRNLNMTGDRLADFMINEARLGLNDGRSFGAPDGYMRMNVACPRSTLTEALARLQKAVENRGETARL